jgi:eukaryotic-like serine/threonine-protein kinase
MSTHAGGPSPKSGAGDADARSGVEAERWRRVRALFEAAVEQDPGEWPLFVATADDDVRELLARLLAADRTAEPLLDRAPDQLAADLLPDSEPLPDRIGKYRIVRLLGRGGMGQVLLGRRDDGTYDQEVAIKLVRRGMDSEDVLRRFRAERQILASLAHPNIATLLDGGIATDGRPYFVLEFVPGSPITAYCEAHAQPLDARLRLFATACSAVQRAHERGVVHRDLKPSNIFVAEAVSPAEGMVKLLDFGIAKLLSADGLNLTAARTHTGTRLMTPEYASPEQFRGNHVGPASDVYSLGLILYELVTGRRPYDPTGLPPAEVERLVCDTPPPRPAREGKRLPAALQAIVLMALRKEPERRYATGGELGDDVRRYLRQEAVRARDDSITYRAGTFVRRRTTALALAVAAAVIGGVYAGWTATAPLVPTAASGPLTVAVLPFHYAGPEGEEYHAGGLADGIDAHLAALSELTVVARPRARLYREPDRTSQEIGAELGAAYVLDGTVRFERPTDPSGRAVVAPRLVRVEDGRTVWTRNFDRTMVQFFALQSTIAAEVARALEIETTAIDWSARGAAPTADLEAYRLYLHGNHFLRYVEDEAWLRLAEAPYLQAVARDSTFAAAWAKLSTVHTRMWFYHYDRSDARMDRAGDAAERALRHDPELAESHYALGKFLYGIRGDMTLAQRHFERALELRPNHVKTLRGLASVQLRLGQVENAHASFERLAVLDPLDSSRTLALDARPFYLSARCIEGAAVSESCQPVERWCAPAGGVAVGGACWFLGAGGAARGIDGANCQEVCGAAGLVYDAATRYFAGSDGTDANCMAVLTSLNAPAFNGFQRTVGRPLGCAVSRDANLTGRPDWVRVTGSSRTEAAARGNEARACACRPPL